MTNVPSLIPGRWLFWHRLALGRQLPVLKETPCSSGSILLWRDEAAFGFPDLPADVPGAKAMNLHQRRDELQRHIDLPAFEGEEYHIQKLSLILSH